MNTLQSDIEHDANMVTAPLSDGLGKAFGAVKNSRTFKNTAQKARQVEGDLSDNIDEAQTAVEHFMDAIVERSQSARAGAGKLVQDHPYAAAGVAFGIGALIAGALFNRSRS